MQVERENLRVIACPHILSVEKGRIDVQRPAGGSVKDILRSIAWVPDGLNARVFIDGEYIKDAAWEYTVPGPGQSVVVRAIPMGGSEGGKDAGRIGAMVAILTLAIVAQQYWAVGLAATLGVSEAVAGAIIVGTISITGTLATSALIPSPLPRRGALPLPARELKEAA